MTVAEQTAPGRRDRKKRLTRDALTTAALRLVAEHGLENVTVEQISEAADVSARTFFNYFSSKDEALIGNPAADRELLLARLVATPPGVPALEAIRLALTETVETMQADRELWRLRLAVIERNPALLTRLIAGNAEAERAIVETIADRLGVPPDHGHPALVAAVAGAAFRTALLRWAAEADTRPLGDLVHEAFAAVAAGLPDPRP
ncbi:TetR family transcriptional regulator [Micromonospora sp. C28SCA-DRY-2]|uniref:TetR/AcrR family transcriptional regulator n=1 Tax=Micromonospora sp. C28SCA-DRY-2 TaxID=3059522 RepID=UPI00267528EC|nr:TetR family transcriptional regulator [Micromonospora sp. C28SCA-DRY-2]MDO3700090.1 TetR family transcriptional regulator [Micromonospora sp. C28SCA-DRY-2]